MLKSSVCVANWGAERDSNQLLNYEKGWDLYSVVVTIHPKPFQ